MVDKTRIGWNPRTSPEDDMKTYKAELAIFVSIRDWQWDDYSDEQRKAAADLADIYSKEDWRLFIREADKINGLIAALWVNISIQ